MSKEESNIGLERMTLGSPRGSHRFFWDADYPQRSLTRIYIVLSIAIYILGRFIDPGPDWLKRIIESLVHHFNLEFIETIAFHTPSTNFWRGGGLALQLQLLITWPLVWIFGIWAGWLNRNGSKDFEKYPPIINKPSITSWMWNFLIVFFLLCMAYFPFQGTDASRPYIATGIIPKDIHSDTYSISLFWIFGGWVCLYLVVVIFYVIHTEFIELKTIVTRKR